MRQAAAVESLSGEPLSLEEWVALPEDEPGELVEGFLEEEEVPSFIHESLVLLLGSIFGAWVRPRGGFAGGSEAKLEVGRKRGRKPDLSVYFPGSRRPQPRGAINVPPDIAVEIVSDTPRDGRRDRVEKVADYAAFGIRWYWIVDPQLRSVEILELGADGRYAHALGATGGVLTEVPGCEGLTLDVDSLWAEIDRLEATEPAP